MSGWKSILAEEIIGRYKTKVCRFFGKIWESREHLVLDSTFIALCGVALLKAIHTTADVKWPYDLDQYRDLGMAQAILDHDYGADHLYAGETIWYNPLVSIIIAAISHATGAPPYLVITHGGVYLNLLAPIAFYFLVVYLFDRWIALAGTVAFLFAPIGDAPSWAAASYSPWLFGPNFVQGFFYLTLAVYCKALESKQWPVYLIVGMLLGITFLGHTAPAVILGAIIIVASVKSSIRQSKGNIVSLVRTKELRGLLLLVCVAFIISLPFTFSILLRYHLRILNPVPGNWVYLPLTIDKLPTIVHGYLSWFSVFAVLGFFVLIIDYPQGRHPRTFLLSWFVVCCGALVLNYMQQLTSPGLHLMFVPVHHFLFYLKAVEDVLFGIGLVFACRYLARNLLSRLFGKSAAGTESDGLQYWIKVALIAVGISLFLVVTLPAYRARFDFTAARDQALGFQQRKAYIDAYHWILSNTKPADVFLSLTGDLDLSIVGPAGRKVVVTCQPEFSNPYVDWKARADTASHIVERLATASQDAPATLAENHVNYIITSPIDQFDHDPFSFLSKEFSEGEIVIYKVQTR